MVQWWNNSETGKQKYSEKNPSQCYFACRKYHMNSDETELICPKSLTNT